MIANMLGRSDGNINYPGLVAAWDIKKEGKDNDHPDRGWLRDLTGNGHDITLNNFTFSEMSGYGGYSTDFTKWGYNQTIANVTRTNAVIKVIEFITGSGVSFVSYNYSGTIKFKISGLTDEIDLRCKTTAKDNTQKQHKLSNGKYNFDSYGFTSFICLNSFIGKCNITIELLPEYPDTLVFDGVDYGINKNMPILTDYTIIAKKVWFKDTQGDGAFGFISKRDISTNQGGAFVIEKNNSINSFGFSNPPQLDLYEKYNIIYQTKNSYCGIPIQFGITKDNDFIVLGAGYYRSKDNFVYEYWKGAFYSAYLFDRSLDEQEIKAFIRKYIDPDYILPSEQES